MTSKSELLTTVVGLYLSNEHVLVDHVALIVDSVQSRRLLTDDEQVDEQDQHARRKWTVRLNSLLQSKESTTRWAALVLLHATCEQSPNLLVANIRSWANQLLGMIAKPDTTLVHKAAVKTLAFLFAYTAGKPELQREITTPSLPRFNHLLLGLSQRADLLDTVLDALATNMKTFPSLSRHAVDHTVKMCLGYLDGAMHVAPSTLDKVSACLIAVHYTGGRATPAEQWKDIVLKLIGSYHQALDRLFATVDEEWTVEDRPEEFPLVPAMADYVVGFSVMMRRIKALQIALSTALGMSTSVAVPVPVGQLVNLICRGYSVFEGSLMREFKDKTEFAALMLNLPAIHQTANKLLTSLLISSGPHLIPFVKLFARLFVRLLGDYQKQRTLKISVYQLTTLCLQKYGLVFAEAIESVVVPNVLQDTTVHVHKVTSVVTTDTKENKKKRKRNDLTHSDAMLAQHATEAPHDIQMAALQTLEQLLLCYGASMDINTRNSIDSHILQRLLEISQKPLALAPESDQLIKEHLYPCLLASVMAPLQVQASILPYAVRIFSAGINEQNLKLQSLCRQGVAICDLIMHPRMPPLQ
ncbi:rRNA processing/ribosome biogenesis-domain-containing protein, partial [Gongronella butleri]